MVKTSLNLLGWDTRPRLRLTKCISPNINIISQNINIIYPNIKIISQNSNIISPISTSYLKILTLHLKISTSSNHEIIMSDVISIKTKKLHIPYICHFFSTEAMFGSIFLHKKVRKLRENRFSDKSA